MNKNKYLSKYIAIGVFLVVAFLSKSVLIALVFGLGAGYLADIIIKEKNENDKNRKDS